MILKTSPKITGNEEYPLFEKSRTFFCECEQCGKKYKIGEARSIVDNSKWPDIFEWFGPWLLKNGDKYCLNLDNPAYIAYYRYCCLDCFIKAYEAEKKTLYAAYEAEKKALYAAYVARNTANSTRRRKERRDAARALRPDPICQYCHQPFKALRSDAKYCSDYCRQNGHRSKKKESKPFLLECFRLPENERKESPLGYRESSRYKNGIGFDNLIETWEGIPAIKDKVKIVKLTKYERLERQEVYFKNSEYSYVKNDSMTRYPFLIFSNDSFLMSMPMCPGDKQLEDILLQIILENAHEPFGTCMEMKNSI